MLLRTFPLRRYVLRTRYANAKYPDREVIKKLADLLAPSKITVNRDPPSVDIRANRDWIKQNRMKYRG